MTNVNMVIVFVNFSFFKQAKITLYTTKRDPPSKRSAKEEELIEQQQFYSNNNVQKAKVRKMIMAPTRKDYLTTNES